MILFISCVKLAKQILLFNTFSPSSLIEEEIRALISIICSQTKYDEFINTAMIITLNIIERGELCGDKVICDTKSEIE